MEQKIENLSSQLCDDRNVHCTVLYTSLLHLISMKTSAYLIGWKAMSGKSTTQTHTPTGKMYILYAS